MTQKVTKKPDISKAKIDLKKAIADKDPVKKWIPILNELKSEINDAKSKNISISQIRKILIENGIKVPFKVLKKFVGKQGSK
jgi:hypothetical protein